MRAVESHPPEEDLRAFALGSLDDAWCQSVEAHLQDCPDCQVRAARLPADALIDLLRLRTPGWRRRPTRRP